MCELTVTYGNIPFVETSIERQTKRIYERSVNNLFEEFKDDIYDLRHNVSHYVT